MWVRLLLIVSLLFGLMLLFCKAPSSAPGPESAYVALEFKSSNGTLTKNNLTDTIGKQVNIWLIHNLTQYIDAPTLRITKDTDFNEVYSVKSFKALVDTIKYPMVFSIPGNYAANFTCYIDNQPILLNGTITIVDTQKTQNQKPDQMPPVIALKSPLNDTVIMIDSCEIQVTCFDDSGCSVKGYRDGIVFDMTKSLSVAHLWNGIAKGIISGKFSTITIVATDSSAAKNRDSVLVKIQYDGDTSKPVLTRVDPTTKSVSTNSSSYAITVACSDTSGVLSVNATLGSKSFAGSRGTGTNWTIPVDGLVSGTANAVVVTAVDSSMRANKDTLNYAITFDPTMLDTIGPTITPVSGPASGSTVTTPTVDIVVSVTDPGEVDSVYWIKNSGTKKIMTPVSGKANQYSLTETLTEGKVDTLTLVAVDKATRHNQTKLTITLNYSEPKYTVTYKGNNNTSGTAPTDPGTYIQGATVTVATAGALVKNGYTFDGWNTAADGSGTARTATTTFNMASANVTLYAQWEIKQYSVTYDANEASNGTPPSDAIKHDTGSTVTVAGNTGGLVKMGCIFDGWNTTADGKGTNYAAGAGTFVITGDTKLFAKWTPKKYKLSYNGNDNTGGEVPDEVSYDSNTNVAVSGNINALTKTGFDFNGWNTSATGSGVAYPAASTFKIKSDTTLFAQWTVKKYKLTIDPPVNGSVNLSGEVNVDSSAATTITATAANGFKFKCWRVIAGAAKITDTASASTTVVLTQGNASVAPIFRCLTFNKTISFSEYTSVENPSIAQGSDGYYYVAFNCKKPGSVNIAAVMKLDLNGSTLWKQEYTDGSINVSVESIRKTSDGCFLLGGTYLYSRDIRKMHLWKIASNKNQVFSWDVGDDAVSGNFAFETSDGGFVIGGTDNGGTAIKTKPTVSEAVWTNSYDNINLLKDGQETSDGGCIFVGEDIDFKVTKTDNKGVALWQKTFSDYSIGSSIRQTTDGGYIIGGQSGAYLQGNHFCGLIKISADGSTEWQKIDQFGDNILAVRQTADGGFVYTGYTSIWGAGNDDMYLVKTKSTGEITWSKAFGTLGFEYVHGLEVCNDGGFIITGSSGENTANHDKIMIVKTDENGDVE
jgi:uncharacterized repeat protein (TIGR02543 family)